MREKILLKKIKEMSYTEFIGFINQWNVPPGANNTLSKWEIFSKLNSNSNLLEIACTTGFSSRELISSGKCKGLGIDISKESIASAIKNKKEYFSDINVKYLAKDAYNFTSEKKFSHIVLGASLKFFPNPEKLIKKCISLLDEGGYLLASPFFIEKKLPKKLIKKFEKIFGISPTTESYKEVMKLYKGFEIIYEEKNKLTKETEEELNHYCQSTIKRACNAKNIKDKKTYDLMYKRLYEIKKMSNELRDYQGYTVLVLRYKSAIYPNRFVELF